MSVKLFSPDEANANLTLLGLKNKIYPQSSNSKFCHYSIFPEIYTLENPDKPFKRIKLEDKGWL
jgi:hypothetical protein